MKNNQIFNGEEFFTGEEAKYRIYFLKQSIRSLR